MIASRRIHPRYPIASRRIHPRYPRGGPLLQRWRAAFVKLCATLEESDPERCEYPGSGRT